MKEILQYVELIPEFKPVVKQTLDNISEYSEEWERIQSFICDTAVNNKSRIYHGFIAKGISADHALALTISSTNEIYNGYKQGLQNQSKSEKESK